MACKNDLKEEVVNEKDELVFDAQKWQIKKGEDYISVVCQMKVLSCKC